MNDKFTTFEKLMEHYKAKWNYDKYIHPDYDKYLPYPKHDDYEKYDTYNPYFQQTPQDITYEFEKLIQRMKEEESTDTKWREALDKMPIGFIEKYLRKKKLANIKQEEE